MHVLKKLLRVLKVRRVTTENQKTVAHTKKETEKLWGQMFIDSINMSKLTFNMDENL